jgi:Cu2+-exporting ATPase
MRLVEDCSQRRAPIVQFADRVAGWFVIVVITLAMATFAIWIRQGFSLAIDHSVALLIVTCPCALGLATPLAVSVALGRAAQKQILIKGGETLELLARPATMFLDKTGTLTAGQTTVVSYLGDAAAQGKIAALERHSAHPIAHALVAAFSNGEREAATWEVTEVREITGRGLSGYVSGQLVTVGSPAFLRGQQVSISSEMAQGEQQAVGAELTPVLVAVDGECVAVIGLGDPLRKDAAEALNRIRALRWNIGILSGDHASVVKSVAQQLEIPREAALGGVTPEGKSAFIQAAVEKGRVVMVGDGVNDAAAFSAATVGIAVHGGAEASLAAADVYLNRPGLTPIVELIYAARRTLRTIHRSLGVSLCYNAIAASLAIAGWISPLLAAVLMPISSFTVLAVVLISRTFGKER